MYGETAVSVVDATGLVSVGKDILSSASTKDKFLDTLVDRIGKTIVSNRSYSANVVSVLKDTFEFGAILQKIYVEPMPAQESKQWDLTNGQSVDQYIITKPVVKQQLFSGINTWEVDVTIPDMQLKSAFTGESQMATFIDAIFVSMRNSMENQLESMLNLTYVNFIAERIIHTRVNGGHTVVNLLAEYNTITGSTLTAAKALQDTEFLKFSTSRINLYLKRMARMSEQFNQMGYKRFTPKEYARVTVLADYSTAVTSFLESDTYHNEMVSLPNYSEVPFWQGSGEEYGFNSTSAINVTNSQGTFTVNQTGIVAMITDQEALGITIDNRRSTTAYNAKGEFTNYFEKADMGYFNDLSENGIVMVVADSIAEPVPVEAGG